MPSIPRFVFIEETNTKGTTMKLLKNLAAALITANALLVPIVLTGNTAHAEPVEPAPVTSTEEPNNDPWEQ